MMRQMFSFSPKRQTGSAGILALIIMTVLGVIGAGFVVLTSTEVSIAGKYRDGVAAQYIAEAGVQWALVKLKDANTGAVMMAETNSVTGRTYPVSPQLGSTPTAGTYQVTIKQDPNDRATPGKRVIISVGTVGKSFRQVIVPVTLTNTGQSAISLQTGTWSNFIPSK